MHVTKRVDGHIHHYWLPDYTLLTKEGVVIGRHGGFDEMWSAWELLGLQYIHWRNEKTQATFFEWR